MRHAVHARDDVGRRDHKDLSTSETDALDAEINRSDGYPRQVAVRQRPPEVRTARRYICPAVGGGRVTHD